MPFNLEIKAPVSSLKKLESKLSVIKAEYAGILIQTDVYYKVKKGLLKLRIENGSEQLIHYFRNETARNRWSDYRILKLGGTGGRKFLSNILIEEVVVKKERKLFWYQDTRIHLDKVKNLGSFIELETRLTGTKQNAKDRFNYLTDFLNLDLNSQIRKSYRDLLLEKSK